MDRIGLFVHAKSIKRTDTIFLIEILGEILQGIGAATDVATDFISSAMFLIETVLTCLLH